MIGKRRRSSGEVRPVISFCSDDVNSSMHAARVAGDEFLIGVTDRYGEVHERSWFCHRVEGLHDFVTAATELQRQHAAAVGINAQEKR